MRAGELFEQRRLLVFVSFQEGGEIALRQQYRTDELLVVEADQSGNLRQELGFFAAGVAASGKVLQCRVGLLEVAFRLVTRAAPAPRGAVVLVVKAHEIDLGITFGRAIAQDGTHITLVDGAADRKSTRLNSSH